ncbi:MAG TPA: hypothetical protein VFN09_14590 [Rhodanobacteraceae bacterium]|nr:hypothetical protein [Rhodanobacteraceae bacterium]
MTAPAARGDQLQFLTVAGGAPQQDTLAWLRRDASSRIYLDVLRAAAGQSVVETAVPSPNNGRPNFVLSGTAALIVLDKPAFHYSLTEHAWHGHWPGPGPRSVRWQRVVKLGDDWLGLALERERDNGTIQFTATPWQAGPATAASHVIASYQRSAPSWGLPRASGHNTGTTPAIHVEGDAIHALLAIGAGRLDVPADERTPARHAALVAACSRRVLV